MEWTANTGPESSSSGVAYADDMKEPISARSVGWLGLFVSSAASQLSLAYVASGLCQLLLELSSAPLRRSKRRVALRARPGRPTAPHGPRVLARGLLLLVVSLSSLWIESDRSLLELLRQIVGRIYTRYIS